MCLSVCLRILGSVDVWWWCADLFGAVALFQHVCMFNKWRLIAPATITGRRVRVMPVSTWCVMCASASVELGWLVCGAFGGWKCVYAKGEQAGFGAARIEFRTARHVQGLQRLMRNV